MRNRRMESSFDATFDGAAALGGCVLAIGLFSLDLNVIDIFAFGLSTLTVTIKELGCPSLCSCMSEKFFVLVDLDRPAK